MILRQFPMEVLLASGYALFLLTVSLALEKLAQHSHRRADQYELAGFRYQHEFDRWQCPTGNHLVRVETDHPRRIVRYRASPHHCNPCTRKKDCTDSQTGREIEHRLDLWLESGLLQFHRAVSLTLVILAGFLLLVEAARHPQLRVLTLLGALFVLALLSGLRLLSSSNASSSHSSQDDARFAVGGQLH